MQEAGVTIQEREVSSDGFIVESKMDDSGCT